MALEQTLPMPSLSMGGRAADCPPYGCIVRCLLLFFFMTLVERMSMYIIWAYATVLVGKLAVGDGDGIPTQMVGVSIVNILCVA